MQEPCVQLFLREVKHLAARFVVRDFLVRCEFVQHTFGHADIHARLLKSPVRTRLERGRQCDLSGVSICKRKRNERKNC